MKRIINIGVWGMVLVFSLTSCKKYLDINKNPNSATTSTPELVLSQALTATANVVNTYNSMGAQLGGYMANAGGYGGFGSSVTYNLGNDDYQNCWNQAYDNLADYQWIINNTEGNEDYDYYNAAAKIMKAYEFQLLVDTYNDVPYTEAFKETENLTPTYDKAQDVYQSIYALLDEAIQLINDGASVGNIQEFSDNDVMFKGNMDNWKRFANTVKLRIALRGQSGGLSFSNSYDPVGFLTTDAVINPGYQKADGKQNPKWNTWGYTYTGSTANRAWMPTEFIAAFYDGSKLNDYRGYAIFNNFGGSSFGTNQLGYESTSVPSAPAAGSWITPYEEQENNIGVLKGSSMAMPIITLAESDFLQAEAALKGGFGVSGSAQDYFYNGILDSYKYIYRLRDGSYDLNGWDPEVDYEAYLSEDLNGDNYLVHYENASSNDQRLEAIITQKYIALNMVNSDQGWNDFRRTGYPKIVNGSTDGTKTFASLQSVSTRPDKLPSRVLYPTSELSYNNANLPKDISEFNSMIFWDPN
ncbi:SusD/RagB family nutrient-binding outer membrane lipoprotein [Parafilimonas terrae]|uniref:Starch-binding associating with outer membrane n=1 Tax=Parafilimonas terrae TaxID=1465490 RepID=A0A1I5Z2Q3_9BACT|nr:SusD/RagB family nutrient-binding outer membrane lipoprotein [Parafilimonas terrae]SFQ50766.1 Starch-binding associating with outer membrane [Parafilimonas terrae]